jgi:hypothetical protein
MIKFKLQQHRVAGLVAQTPTPHIGTCRVCGCTDNDCRRCIERTGLPCWWIEPGLCSACDPRSKRELAQLERHLRRLQGLYEGRARRRRKAKYELHRRGVGRDARRETARRARRRS